MHVLIGTNTLVSGSGIDRVVITQAQELQAQGHTVKVVCFHADLPVPPMLDVIQLGSSQSLSWESVRRLAPFLNGKQREQAKKLVAWADIVYAHQYPWTTLGVWAKKTNKKFIFTNHGVADPASFHSTAHKVYVWLVQKCTLQSAVRADEVWSVSSALAQEWEGKTGGKSIVYRPVEKWINTAPVHSPLEAQHILEQQVPYFLCVGRISAHKGIHLLLEVITQVRKKFPEVELKIIGLVADEHYAKELKEKNTPGVFFLGRVSDKELALWFQGCQALVSAATWEGWNLPIQEALAFQRPVVCFDLPAHQEFTSPLVHLVPKGNISAFAASCEKLLA